MSTPGNPFADLAQQQQRTDNGNPFNSVQASSDQPPQQSPQDARAGLGIGVLQGAGQTIGTVAGLINKIPGVGEYLAPSAGMQALRDMSTPHTMAEKAGVITEGVGEFVLGDEALKSLSLASRFRLGAKIAELAETHPVGANIINHGLAAIRGGTVVTGQQLLHGATPAEAVKSGAEAAALGTGIGALSEGVPALKNVIKPLVSEDAAATTAQPEVQQAVRDVAKATEPAAVETPSIRSAVESAADEVLAKSKDAYRTLDEASGGRWQRFSDQIKNLQQKMNEVAGIDDDAFEKFELMRNEIETVQSNLVDDLVSQGKIDAGLADEAKANFKKSMALQDLDAAVKSSTTGVRPEQATANSTPETLDPAKLNTRLQKLNDSGRLAQAIGEDGAKQLIQRVDGALRSKTTAISRAKFIKSALKYTAIGGAALKTGQGLAHILGGK